MAGITARYFICYRFFAGFLPSAQEVLWGLTAPRLELWGGKPQAGFGLEFVVNF